MKTFWNLLLHNHYFKLLLFVAFAVIGAVLMGVFNVDNLFSNILFATGLGGLLVYAIVMMLFAWIINPIRSLKEKRKKK